MSDLDELRRQFYQTDDESNDPYAFANASGSGRGGASSSTTLNTSSPRMRPYPPRTGSAGEKGASRRGRGKPRESESRLTRALRAAGDEDEDGGSGTRRVGGRRRADDAMDVDLDADILGIGRKGNVNDVQLLVRAWQNERHAPDILPVCSELLARVLDSIREQVKTTETLRTADVSLSEEDHYRTTLVQTEVERVKFIVRSYVRTRLFKIEQYAAYILENKKELEPRLTRAEAEHARRYGELVVSQFTTAVLSHLPEIQQGLDDEPFPATPPMLTEPDKNKPVFFHAFSAIEGLQMDNETTQGIERDGILLVPYHVIEQHLLRGEGELV